MEGFTVGLAVDGLRVEGFIVTAEVDGLRVGFAVGCSDAHTEVDPASRYCTEDIKHSG